MGILQRQPDIQQESPVLITLSGRSIQLLSPSPADIDEGDVIDGLDRVNRFNGQLRGKFSVASHSVLVSLLVEKLYPNSTTKDQMAALFHDAPEAFLGDQITPLKQALQALGSGAYDLETIHNGFAAAIFAKVLLPWPPAPHTQEMIALADATALKMEDRAFRGGRLSSPGEVFPDVDLPSLAPGRLTMRRRYFDLLRRRVDIDLPLSTKGSGYGKSE